MPVFLKKVLLLSFCAFTLLCAIFFLSSPARAACANPIGAAGTIVYNSDVGMMQYCDNVDWVAMGPEATSVGVTGPTTGLVSHWKLDETSGTTAVDSVGGYDGTMIGGMDASVDSVAGFIDTALDFNGTSKEIQTTAYQTGLTATFTISAWIKMVSADTATRPIVGRDRDNTHRDFQFRVASGKVNFIRFFSGSLISITGTTSVNDGNWHHVAVVFDNTVGTTLYVDGNSEAFNATLTNSLDTVQPTIIGDEDRGATPNFLGQIDDVRFYNVALSTAEIGDLYALTPPPPGATGYIAYDDEGNVMKFSEGSQWIAMGSSVTATEKNQSANIIGWWKLNDGSGTTATDSSGSGNDGTLVNMDSATDWVTGKYDGALDFDGSNDYVDVGNFQTLAGSAEMSMSFWFYARLLPTIVNDNDSLVMQHDSYNSQFGCRFGTNIFACYAEKSGIVSDVVIPHAGNFVTDTWYHIAMVFDSGTVKVYVNGSLYDQDYAAGVATLPDLSNNMTLGGGPTGYFNGKLDDVRIYDRALTDLEVEDIYANSSCANPDAVPGTMIYNATHAVMQYCNGEAWVGIGK